MKKEKDSTSSPQNISEDNQLAVLPLNNVTDINPSHQLSGGGTKINNWEGIKNIGIVIAIIVGIISIIVFLAGIIVTQNNIKNEISNLKTSLETYHTDFTLLKVQIENWFSQISIKIDSLKK